MVTTQLTHEMIIDERINITNSVPFRENFPNGGIFDQMSISYEQEVCSSKFILCCYRRHITQELNLP